MIYWMRRPPAPWAKAVKALTILAGAAALALDVHAARPQPPFDLHRERPAISAPILKPVSARR